MTPTDPPSIDRLHDLLALRATEGLTPADGAELQTLLEKWPHLTADAFDAAAAALATAEVAPEPVPPHLMKILTADAVRMVRPTVPQRSRNWPAVLGWATAAAVLIGVAANEFRPRPGPADARRFTADVADVSWSQAAQEGTLTVRGLPPNDPAQSQYQLWVIDAGRGRPGQVDVNNRVDGGVFDVAADGTATVRVKPGLRVFEAAAFAVTEEPPGGVIVSRAAENVKVVLTPAAR